MKFYKMMFFLILILGTLISISSSTWLGIWIGLEINLLSIIPLFSKSQNLFSSESTLKYFLTQALASTILLFSILIFPFFKNSFLILNSSLLMKMGAAPFHFWFPEVIEGLTWFNSLILLTWQKIAPMIILSYNIYNNMFFYTIIIMNFFISGILGLNQISLRKILAFSSINHIGWMISSMMMMNSIWTIYFLIYSVITMNLIWLFKKLNIFFINQLNLLNNLNLKLFFSLNFFSLGGLPPFLGFLPKWLIIENLISNNLILLSLIMIIMTLITLFFYTRLMFSSLTLINSTLKFYSFKINNSLFLSLNFIMMLSFIICTLILMN